MKSEKKFILWGDVREFGDILERIFSRKEMVEWKGELIGWLEKFDVIFYEFYYN